MKSPPFQKILYEFLVSGFFSSDRTLKTQSKITALKKYEK